MVLNLVEQERSTVKYKISNFPDGQQTVDITVVRSSQFLDETVLITSRLNSFKDLELIVCANQALKNLGASHISLYVPYFLGARSDRKFMLGGVNYLKQVICPIINSQGFDHVTVLDPHSDVLEACLNNFEKISNHALVKFAFEEMVPGRRWDNPELDTDKIALISPDAGALKKIYDIGKNFGITNVTTASKVRDIATGNIVRTELPTMDLDGIEHFVIIDDICDGGRTFIELAKEIKKQTDKPIYLIVTHGIFSAGYAGLGELFKQIYTTNSIKNIGETEYHAMENVPTKVKQLEIF